MQIADSADLQILKYAYARGISINCLLNIDPIYLEQKQRKTIGETNRSLPKSWCQVVVPKKGASGSD